VKIYIANIALGIGALHKKNIIHRDIKLPNILIDEDGYLILSDFGVAL
jgi:serine/threonine protein kinase